VRHKCRICFKLCRRAEARGLPTAYLACSSLDTFPFGSLRPSDDPNCLLAEASRQFGDDAETSDLYQDKAVFGGGEKRIK
jgi:hypothetical protein